MGETSGKYGVLNNHAIKLRLKEQGKSGPVTELVMSAFSIIGNLFSLIVYNFSVPSYNPEQGIMYSLLAAIALGIFSFLRIPETYYGIGKAKVMMVYVMQIHHNYDMLLLEHF